MNKRIYFFLIPEAVSRDNYAHCSLVLAEGLRSLGYDIFANIDYWKSDLDSGELLFRKDANVHPEDCEINVLTYDWMYFVNVIPYQLAENKKSLRVYLEDAGWLMTPGLTSPFRIFDVIFKAHFNRLCEYPDNFKPWSFGLSNRMLREGERVQTAGPRERKLLVNFGATHNAKHQLRELCEQQLYPSLSGFLEIDRSINRQDQPPTDPYHALMWQQTAGRHFPDYYDRLAKATACASYGGYLVPETPHDWSSLHGGGKRMEMRRRWHQFKTWLFRRQVRCNQWESWRFWESLVTGCVPFMLDFEKYGIQLPVQPTNWVHYVGFDLDQISANIDRLRSDDGLLQRVSEAGRQWAIDHYSPLPVAKRFLATLGVS